MVVNNWNVSWKSPVTQKMHHVQFTVPVSSEHADLSFRDKLTNDVVKFIRHRYVKGDEGEHIASKVLQSIDKGIVKAESQDVDVSDLHHMTRKQMDLFQAEHMQCKQHQPLYTGDRATVAIDIPGPLQFSASVTESLKCVSSKNVVPVYQRVYITHEDPLAVAKDAPEGWSVKTDAQGAAIFRVRCFPKGTPMFNDMSAFKAEMDAMVASMGGQHAALPKSTSHEMYNGRGTNTAFCKYKAGSGQDVEYHQRVLTSKFFNGGDVSTPIVMRCMQGRASVTPPVAAAKSASKALSSSASGAKGPVKQQRSSMDKDWRSDVGRTRGRSVPIGTRLQNAIGFKWLNIHEDGKS